MPNGQGSYITKRIDLRPIETQKYLKMNEQRIIFPRFSLDDVDPLWRQNALVLPQKMPFVKRNLTIGIVTAKRPNGISYLYDTLESLVNNTDPNDLSSICIVILLADFDGEWRNNVARFIKEKYPSMILNGTILLLQSFNWMYPRLENLTHHYIGHSESRVKWKAKQNIDFAFLWLYVFKEKLSEYYLHLEDDVITIPNYIKIIYSFINLQKNRWTCLEFSELGMIAKLYHTQNLETLAKMVTLFYEEQPADYTYLNFNPQMLQFRRIIRKPTLFQHIGRNSSLPGKIMLVQDRFFMKESQKKLKGDNPPATLETSLSINPGYPPESAYYEGFGHFWSESGPRKGDFFRIQFISPQNISRIVVVSGTNEFPTDILYHAVLETSYSLNKTNSCIDYKVIAHFTNGTVDISNVASMFNRQKLHCLQIRIVKPRPFWVLIKEIAVYLMH